MHMDNPMALAAAIINDIYGLRLPLEPNEQLIRAAMGEGFLDLEQSLSIKDTKSS